MIKIYIDFDGVILDTWIFILENYYKKYKTLNLKEYKIKEIMNTLGWNLILSNSYEIKDSIKKINNISKDYCVCILSKINSLEEKEEKEKFLISNGIYNMCFVPYNKNKSDFVNAKDNILIDDDINNLIEWEKSGGRSIFFNKDLNDYDSYGNKNEKYKIIDDLLDIYDII